MQHRWSLVTFLFYNLTTEHKRVLFVAQTELLTIKHIVPCYISQEEMRILSADCNCCVAYI